MRYQDVGHIAFRVARIAGMSGGATAGGSILKLFPIGNPRTVKPVLCLSLLGAAVALFQFQQVKADDGLRDARFVPSVIISSAFLRTAMGILMEWLSCHTDFHKEGHLNQVIS